MWLPGSGIAGLKMYTQTSPQEYDGYAEDQDTWSYEDFFESEDFHDQIESIWDRVIDSLDD